VFLEIFTNKSNDEIEQIEIIIDQLSQHPHHQKKIIILHFSDKIYEKLDLINIFKITLLHNQVY
jgi:hypothetical protein